MEGTALYVVRRYPVLSQTFVVNEVEKLRAMGWRVEVMSVLPSGQPGSPSADHELTAVKPGFRMATRALVHLLRAPRRTATFLKVARQVRSEMPGRRIRTLAKVVLWAERLRPQAPDIVHAHFGWEGASVAWLLGALLNRPWGVTLHANDMFGDPQNLGPKVAAADLVVTVCDYNIEWLNRHTTPRRAVQKVICGVSVPDHLVAREPTIEVLAVGRLVEKKGFDLLIEAVARLAPEFGGLRCVIVGDGPERAALQRAAAKLGVADNIRFAGPQPHSEVLRMMLETRLVAVPSRTARDGDVDSMPLVAKEAMARAVPVVAAAVGGIPEMVDDEVGKLVPPEDASALAAGIRELLVSKAEIDRRGAAARARVRERFNLDVEVARMSRLLSETAQRGSG